MQRKTKIRRIGMHHWLWSMFILTSAFFAFSVAFQNRIFPGVHVGPVAVGGLTAEQARDKVWNYLAQKPQPRLVIGQTVLTPSEGELGIAYHVDASVTSAMRSEFSSVPLQFHWESEILARILKDYEARLGFAPANAQLSVEGNDVAIVEDHPGFRLDEDGLRQQLTPFVTQGKLALADLPLVPSEAGVRTQDLVSARDDAARLLAKTYTLSADKKTFALTRDTLKHWLVSRPPVAGVRVLSSLTLPADDQSAVGLDEDQINTYLENLAVEVDKPATPQRLLVSKNKTEVLQFGKPGRRLDIEKATTLIEQNVLALTDDVTVLPFFTEEPAMISVAPPPAPISKGKVIAVDLTKMVEYLYDNGQLVYSSKISPGINNWTPTGTFRIYGKTKKQKMSGRGYYVPNVPNILWFKGDYSLHGVYWHNDFGVKPRSHGCVGEPLKEAEWVYNWTPVGTPLVIYKS